MSYGMYYESNLVTVELYGILLTYEISHKNYVSYCPTIPYEICLTKFLVDFINRQLSKIDLLTYGFPMFQILTGIRFNNHQ